MLIIKESKEYMWLWSDRVQIGTFNEPLFLIGPSDHWKTWARIRAAISEGARIDFSTLSGQSLEQCNLEGIHL